MCVYIYVFCQCIVSSCKCVLHIFILCLLLVLNSCFLIDKIYLDMSHSHANFHSLSSIQYLVLKNPHFQGCFKILDDSLGKKEKKQQA